MRILVGCLVVMVLGWACVPPNPAQQPGPYDPNAPQAPQGPPGASSGASCEGACAHYLQCKGVSDAATFQGCVGQCAQLQVTYEQLAQYQQTDCASAIQIVEGAANQGTRSNTSGTDCKGCVKDGDSCVWMSQSNWGAGAYSGAVISCASSCCGR